VVNGGRSNPAGVTEFRRMCCRTRGGGSPELEPCDWRRDRLTRRRGDAERGHWDGKPGCHRLVHGGRRWSFRDRPLTPRSPRLRVRSLPDGHGCAALSGLVSRGGGLPRAAPLASSGLALGYHPSPRWGWGARNGVLEMLGRRSWHLAMLDSRFVAVEPVFYLVALIAIALGFCWVNDRFTDVMWRWRNPPEKRDAERRAREARIASPDWVFYERHLQRPAPASLRELYSDQRVLLSRGIDYGENQRISSFQPLDPSGLVETRDLLGFDVVPLADSEGDMIYLRPGPAERDAVYILYHDGSETEELAVDVSVFVARVRQAVRGLS